ncbi:DoxX family membrane protein [candidate division WWE3 bacterium]|uniref:DoxX family membrane protein n=1 Tax=candidate division WWE3 bacterium TaxID=2053526 RepID=A0A928Y561_UNCKA|nr:DoxX family membrane protein [candidate division WWE3 bacterium]
MKTPNILLAFLRLSLGWIFFWAGISKVADPAWSAAGFLKNAQTFHSFFSWWASPSVLPVTNFLNEWGLLLIGLSLITGLFVRLSSFFGILLMALYYCARLKFPYPDANSFIVDSHIVYALLLGYFIAMRAGRVYGLDGKIQKLKRWKNIKWIGVWLG